MAAHEQPRTAWRDLGGIAVRGLIASRFRLAVPAPGRNPTRGGPVRPKVDAQGRVELVVRVLLVRGGGTLTLVDAGLGEGPEGGSDDSLRIAGVQGTLAQALAGADIAPHEVTQVVLTHLHLDHAGGLGFRRHGEVVPILPQAGVYLQRRQWEAARAGLGRARAFRRREIELLERVDLRLLEGETQVAPGVRVRPTDGHSPGLQVVIVSGDRETLTYASDLVPTLAHLRAAGRAGVDADPARLASEKQALTAATAERQGLLVFVHDPLTAACRLRPSGRGVAACERVAF